MLLLGEAYAFGVVWSFVFQALAMVVLRFKDPRPRESKVPLNIRVGKYEVPIGLTLILAILVISAVANLFTKVTATIGGTVFTAIFFTVFWISERFYEGRQRRTAGTSRTVQRDDGDGSHAAGPWSDKALLQIDCDPVASQPLPGREGAGGNRPGDDKRSRDDSAGDASSGRTLGRP